LCRSISRRKTSARAAASASCIRRRVAGPAAARIDAAVTHALLQFDGLGADRRDHGVGQRRALRIDQYPVHGAGKLARRAQHALEAALPSLTRGTSMLKVRPGVFRLRRNRLRRLGAQIAQAEQFAAGLVAGMEQAIAFERQAGRFGQTAQLGAGEGAAGGIHHMQHELDIDTGAELVERLRVCRQFVGIARSLQRGAGLLRQRRHAFQEPRASSPSLTAPRRSTSCKAAHHSRWLPVLSAPMVCQAPASPPRAYQLTGFEISPLQLRWML
jgi:hypothetical protein